MKPWSGPEPVSTTLIDTVGRRAAVSAIADRLLKRRTAHADGRRESYGPRHQRDGAIDGTPDSRHGQRVSVWITIVVHQGLRLQERVGV